ncbi:hypothetical protein ACHAWF_002748 [Thalassiosira exigua]
MHRRPVTSYEKLFASSSPALGTTCQWMRLARGGGGGGSVPCSRDESIAALRSVHRRIVPLRCVLERDEDSGDVVLSHRPDLEPAIVSEELPEDYDGTAPSPECLERRAAEEATKGMGPTPEAAFGKALWRAIVFNEGWVVLIFHHVICDGSSRKTFTKRMVEALADPTAEGAEIELRPGVCEMLEDAMENGQGDEQKDDSPRDEGAVATPPLPSEPCWPSPDERTPVARRINQAPSAAIPEASVLREKCRSHGVTVTSAIVAALALAIRRQRSAGPNARDAVAASEAVPAAKMGFGVDVRRHLPLATEPFGCYVVGCEIEDAVPLKADDALWPVARTLAPSVARGASLDVAVAKCHGVRERMAAPMSPEALGRLMELVEGPDQGRTAMLNVSNVGVVDGTSSCGTVRVDKLFSITSQNALGSYAFMNVATIGDRLFVTLGTVWPTVSKERGRAILDDFCAILKDA